MVGVEAFLKCLILSLLPCIISGCIYLLNGWTPVSVYDRTSLAEIVISGTVLQTFKEERTKSETYESKIKIKEIYKGKNLLDKIDSLDSSDIFIVGNFGDKNMCYSDVSEGEKYIFFLTVYKNRLSAKYDDFFGAVVEDTWYTEEEVYNQLGWNEWSEWSPCSSSCNGGQQQKRRACSKVDTSCDGINTENRQCNTFACTNVKDFLEIFGVYKLPLGVTIDTERHTAYNITKIANLYSPLATVFQDFPKDFSMLFSVKINKGLTGYLVTLSDITGIQKIAIQYGDMTLFEYSDQNNLPGEKSPIFDIPIADGKWHQFAFSVKRRYVTLYFDCDNIYEQHLSRSKHSTLGNNLMFSVGPYFARYGAPFEGLLEQAIIIPDPEAAQQQCHDQAKKSNDGGLSEEKAIKDEANKESGNQNRTKRKRKKKNKVVNEKPAQKVVPVEWSSWSRCTVTCGTGTQSRSRYCRNNEIEVEECLPDHSQVVQNRLCYLEECKVVCSMSCMNGASCGNNGTCECLPGYRGHHCERAICKQACENGGKCLSPGICFCPSGYYGHNCQNAICDPSCLNGGKCIRPGVCSCPSGFSEPFCTPLCDITCHNGGKCIRHNKCKCKRGYTGKDCTKPICRRGCQNGGKCVSKNRCSCPQGFRGRRCQKAICRPSCKHGACVMPNVCKCKRGYYGSKCEEFKCKRTCKNGGTCIAPNKCMCLSGYSGKWCHIGRCTIPCMNGGKCRKDKCRCPKGFRGDRCEIRMCQYERYDMPYQQTYKTLVREDYTTNCGTWRWKSCVKTRVKYELVTKTMNRTSYRCI